MFTRTYKDKKQSVLPKRHIFIVCCLLIFLVTLVFVSKGVLFGFSLNSVRNSVLFSGQRGSEVLRGGKSAVNPFQARLTELEKQVAIYTRLLRDTKQEHHVQQKAKAQKIEDLEAKLELSKRNLHKLSSERGGAGGNHDSASPGSTNDNVNVLPPIKIYVYDMPAYYNTEQSELNPDCRHDYSTTWQTKYTLEVYLHEQLLKSPLRTKDPDEANLFYVPLYISCYMHARATNFFRANDHVRSSLNWVKHAHPFWNRTLGRDHVWTFTHDIGACVAPYREMHHSIFITNTGELHDRSTAMAYYTGMYSPDYQQKKRDMSLPCFDPWKDIVAPPMINDQSMISSKGGSREGHHKRTVLASFRGTILSGGTWGKYSRMIRQTWQKVYEGDDEIKITAVHPREGMGSRKKATHYAQTYRADFLNSKFCLCPPGWATWTPRLYEALMLGCVPVVVADDNVLPYSRTLDYSKFSVHVGEKYATKLRPILKKAEERIEDLRAGMKNVFAAFVYNTPTPKPGDAFYRLMWDLHHRVKTLGVMNGMIMPDPWVGRFEETLSNREMDGGNDVATDDDTDANTT